jgi:hypothetical protein
MWSRTLQELFHSTLDRRIMVASYIVEANTFRAEKPRLWSETRYIPRAGEAIDLHPLGDGFALAGVVE